MLLIAFRRNSVIGECLMFFLLLDTVNIYDGWYFLCHRIKTTWMPTDRVVVHKASTASWSWLVSVCLAFHFFPYVRNNVSKAAVKKTIDKSTRDIDCDLRGWPVFIHCYDPAILRERKEGRRCQARSPAPAICGWSKMSKCFKTRSSK